MLHFVLLLYICKFLIFPSFGASERLYFVIVALLDICTYIFMLRELHSIDKRGKFYHKQFSKYSITPPFYSQ